MLKKRTHRGTPIRRTLGMRLDRPMKNWFMTIDRHRLCLFEQLEESLEPDLRLRQEILFAEGRAKGHELVSDRPGRSFDRHNQAHHGQTGATRHAYGGAEDPTDQVVQLVVKNACEVACGIQIPESDACLTVFAEPRLLGRLRPALEGSVSTLSLEFEPKDLAWLGGGELLSTLHAYVSAKESASGAPAAH